MAAATSLVLRQESFSSTAYAPITNRRRRLLHAIRIRERGDSSTTTPSHSRTKSTHPSDAVRRYADALLRLLLAAPGMPPQAQVNLLFDADDVSPVDAFSTNATDTPPPGAYCIELDPELPRLDIHLPARIDPLALPAVLAHQLAHGIALHSTEALSAMILAGAPLAAFRPLFLYHMLRAPGSDAGSEQRGPAAAARMVLGTVSACEPVLSLLVVRPRLHQFELEADRIGASIMARVGLDPDGVRQALQQSMAASERHEAPDSKGYGSHCLPLFGRTARVAPAPDRRIRHLSPHLPRLQRLQQAVLHTHDGSRAQQIERLRRQVHRLSVQLPQSNIRSRKGSD
ncbi:hypothetical protein CDCA_CDCA16G4268 [Cyanidium caldarium]|uniref:Peptidase M48 domain-containing protein n=1 Tax=Cyanidium caldarium TaxID=2771 RepID=A0AAV9J0X2_CYACA|nr:hypothetical protein CDCA_CDCA16G4268 [Cyanidium caldarium]